jgi:glycosyltransferase involved in cell wall biosynthesis
LTSVLLCTEGTYPFVEGGVSTWCDSLCSRLEDVEFTLFALTASPDVDFKYTLPPNATRLVHVPLYGALEPSEYLLGGPPVQQLIARKRATTPEVIERQFLPLLRGLLRGIDGKEAPVHGVGVVHGLWSYFKTYDWKASWKSEPAWRAFVDSQLAAHDFRPGERPSLYDLTSAARWLYHFIQPLAAPIPRADVAHTTISSLAALPCIVAKREYGSAFVATDHGVSIRERYISLGEAEFTAYGKRFLARLAAWVARLTYTYADVVAPVVRFNHRWEVRYGADPARIETIYNGVDPQVFAPRPKPPGPPTVLAAARVYPLKDIETMIRSAGVVRGEIPDVRFLLYGSLSADPAYVERCRALIAQLGLEETFFLKGPHAKPSELYSEGDLTVLSSISEAFPYTVLESMACARPVVGTDVGGVREALEGFGLIVPPRDPASLGRAILMLLQDDELRLELGRRAREEVLARFRITDSVDSYRRLYRRLAAQREAA